ncbi:MAG TPA: hypothetical protein VFW10_07165 [Steroidobacteraceae bacterium]|nr:hypothetical protein [Steroidobacteraceae bacterium]
MANTLIHENRRLQFPLDTLVDALIELEDKQGHWPSKATVVGATIDNPADSEAAVVLSIHRQDSGEVSERRYSLPMLAAAIVNYCLTMRVPIPRNSTKSIQVLTDGVALVLENTVMVQTRHEELSTLAAGTVRPLTSKTADAAPDEKPASLDAAPEAKAAADAVPDEKSGTTDAAADGKSAASEGAPAAKSAAGDAASDGKPPVPGRPLG